MFASAREASTRAFDETCPQRLAAFVPSQFEQHLKLVLKQSGRVIDAIAFRQPPLAASVRTLRTVYRLNVNDFGDWPTAQLVLEYLEPAPTSH